MATAFHLEVLDGGLATLTFDLPGRGANVFNRAVMAELAEIVSGLGGRSDIRCLALLSGKPRIFIAGADIEEISKVEDAREAEAAARAGQQLFSAWESLPFPTLAAVRGTCVGGGTEIALASTYILTSDREDIRIGLPEIRLGIVPGWGGCTRLPRRIGLAAALDIILAGKTVRPAKAFKLGLADALLPDASFGAEVRRFAERVMAGEKPRRRGSDLKRTLLEKNPIGRAVVFDQARKQVMKQTKGKYPAPLRAIEVVRAGVGGMRAGFDAEARAIGELATTAEARNLVHVFRLMESAKRPVDGELRRVGSVGVLGAGVMGGGIAQIAVDKLGLPVRMKDIGMEQLTSGMAHAAGLFGKQVKRRWVSKPEAARKMALIRPTLDYSGFESVDLVIEAVVERLDVKRQVFADIERTVADDAILATNTSSISIDLISEGLARPERVVGMHFFNPVHKMPLVEVIRGSGTSADAVATVVAVTRALGKTPVVVGDGPGFLVNRLLSFTLAEAMWLIEEGHAIEDLDRAMTAWGMPMGPATLTDEVGIDVAVKVGHIMADAFGDRLSFPEWFDRLVEDGRLGSKVGRGFYLYEKGRRGGVDPDVYRLLGVSPQVKSPDPDRLIDRIVLPMLNEAARCLEERIVEGPGALDLAMIMGTGFPPFRGGLCRWADDQGAPRLLEAMERLESKQGPRFSPAQAMRDVAADGGFYARYA